MTVVDQLPILIVIIPLLTAPLCVLLDNPLRAWFTALAASWLSFISTIAMIYQTLNYGPVSYMLGNWDAPWGIEYRIDTLSAFVLLIITAMATLVLIFAKESVKKEIAEYKIARFYAAFMLAFAGLLGIVATADAFNVFVFLEISSLASYALIAMGKDKRALNAAFTYLVMGTIGATFILIGIGFLYMMTGTLNMHDLANRIPAVADTTTIRAGFAFLTVGIGLKLALFPLHLWLPNAYAYAPSVVTAFLAATATKVAVYLLLRFILVVFTIDFSLSKMPLDALLMVLGLIGIFSASLVAMYQLDVKRLFAYSSVAQIGYMVLGIGLATTTGITATILHLFNHALMKGALFIALGCIAYRIGSTTINDFKGLSKSMPWTMAGIVAAGISLIGVPGSVGFISKWYLILAALERGYWPIAMMILIGSILAVIYVWRLIEAAYFDQPEQHNMIHEAPLSMLVPLWILVIANFYLGINTELTVAMASEAASVLTGVVQ